MSADYRTAERWMKRERDALQAYLENERASDFPESSRAGLTNYAAGLANIGHATVGLEYLAGYEGALGCSQVLQGDEAGFALIDRACLYNYWAVRLLACAYDADSRPEKQARTDMENVAPCWMHASALGAQAIRDWLDPRIELIDKGDESIGGKDMNPLCTLMAHFVTKRNAGEIKRHGWGSIGPYASVAQGSLKPDDYELLAEYHAKNVGTGGYQPFWRLPYRLYPGELLAIEKLTGVPITMPRHPLLTSPLARRREVPTIPVPDDLKAVIKKARSEFTT
ncbi:MAG TPA: hypothetical protein VKQ32_26825 [Polyangia bacterium]|nr:hypothetical protein [Polyangia bacterium]